VTWEDCPGWFDWKAYYDEVVDRYDGGLLVEVGSYLGRSGCYLGQRIKNSGKPFHLVLIDWCLGSGVENGHDHHAAALRDHGGSLAGKLHRNVCDCGLQDVVTLVIAESGRAASLFADNSVTMCFLDARHDYVDVHRDISVWLPKVKVGGEIAGDDYGIEGQEPVWPGVRRAVDDLLPQRRCVPHDAWAYRKR
jgi:predicted O-methyltransferase YrrM